MKFLIVEDETEVADVLRRSLETLGHVCLIATDANAAQAMLEDDSIGALTVDLDLPGGVSGLEWLESVAAERPDLARKTLVVSGQSVDAEVVERLVDCGSGLLAKPFTLEGLEAAVRSQIDRPGEPRHD